MSGVGSASFASFLFYVLKWAIIAHIKLFSSIYFLYVIYFISMHIHSIYVRRVQLLGSLVGMFSFLVTLKNQIKSNSAEATPQLVETLLCKTHKMRKILAILSQPSIAGHPPFQGNICADLSQVHLTFHKTYCAPACRRPSC